MSNIVFITIEDTRKIRGFRRTPQLTPIAVDEKLLNHLRTAKEVYKFTIHDPSTVKVNPETGKRYIVPKK